MSTLPDTEVTVPSGQTMIGKQESNPIVHPRLWSPETPVLYRAETSLLVSGDVVDHFETEFGFRSISWTADRGFFLNGKHRYFRGANVHQDQAGWGDAVTNKAIDRDVQLMKDAGFDFIRGSHYPHDPHFAEATDRIGLMFLSEVPFWGTAGFNSPWAASAYPTNPAQDRAFDASVKQQLTEMIRINRNHPSIIAWGMDNEVFFSAKETMPQVRRLLAEEVSRTSWIRPAPPLSTARNAATSIISAMLPATTAMERFSSPIPESQTLLGNMGPQWRIGLARACRAGAIFRALPARKRTLETRIPGACHGGRAKRYGQVSITVLSPDANLVAWVSLTISIFRSVSGIGTGIPIEEFQSLSQLSLATRLLSG